MQLFEGIDYVNDFELIGSNHSSSGKFEVHIAHPKVGIVIITEGKYSKRTFTLETETKENLPCLNDIRKISIS